MSLYDKYHSNHNKQYMYNLITNLIVKQDNKDFRNNNLYNDFFEKNFLNTFKVVDTEELSVLNKYLLDSQIEYVNNFLNNQIENSSNDSQINDYIIHSFKRIVNLKTSSRHNYRIKHSLKSKSFQIEKVIIPIENDILFINPNLIITIDTSYIELFLRGTVTLRNREYGIYTPYSEKSIKVNTDISSIQFKNQFLNTRKKSDIYKIISVQNENLIINSSLDEFKQGDYIQLYNFDSIDIKDPSCLKQQYIIKTIKIDEDNIILKLNKNLSDIEGLYVVNMSLQNTIHLIN